MTRTREAQQFERLCQHIERVSGLQGGQLTLLCNRAARAIRKFEGDVYEIEVSASPAPPEGYVSTLEVEAAGKVIYLHLTVD